MTYFEVLEEMRKVAMDRITELKQSNEDLHKQILFQEIYSEITDSIGLSKLIDFEKLFDYSKDKQKSFSLTEIENMRTKNLDEIQLLENRVIPIFDELKNVKVSEERL